jgi:hypothetical protein
MRLRMVVCTRPPNIELPRNATYPEKAFVQKNIYSLIIWFLGGEMQYC